MNYLAIRKSYKKKEISQERQETSSWASHQLEKLVVASSHIQEVEVIVQQHQQVVNMEVSAVKTSIS